MQKLSLGILTFKEIQLPLSSVHLLRGYVGNIFREHDLIHNHNSETNKTFYRYPLVQFKSIGNTPVIFAITGEAVDIFKKVFLQLKEIRIKELVIPINEKELDITEGTFGVTEEWYSYQFITPWIGLNQKNHKSYAQAQKREQEELLKRCLIGNIISTSKGLDYNVPHDQRIKVEIKLQEKAVNLKGKEMLGFTGYFKTNFLLPDLMGIGKAVSRGYGTVEKLI